jgi:hypothetical protein
MPSYAATGHSARGPLVFTAVVGVLVIIVLQAVMPRTAGTTQGVSATAAPTATSADRSAYLGPSARPPQPVEMHSELVTAPQAVVIGAGETATITLAYKNTGAERWIKGSPSEVRLGIMGDSTAFGDLGVEWPAPTRPAVQQEAEVLPGATATFTFKVKGTKTGSYRIPLLPVCDGVTWMEGDALASVTVR